MTQYPTAEMIEAARQASDWVADLRDHEIGHIYLAMRAKEQSHSPTEASDPRMEKIMRSAAFRGTEHQYDIEADATGDDVERYPLTASIWRRGDEWVLEIAGTINDCNFVSRHTEPATTPLEDVAGLPSLYVSPNENSFPNDATKRMAKIMGCDFVRNDKWQPSGSPNGVRLRNAAQALIDDLRRRYPGEELRCEYMRELDAALSTQPASDTGLREALVDFANAAEKCAEPPHYIVQPFLGLFKKHGALIESIRTTLETPSDDGSASSHAARRP